ncbi:uncharacterized protein LOC133904567 [Phragmites australis]|uniref:uncharacterized protein LOC133904567 n=1 Tax=Phragmites australis TaxID=29695 RepID=UPI002D76BEC9|nr:uncharacterized protein LOC133904567 [Phragmites australis]
MVSPVWIYISHSEAERAEGGRRGSGAARAKGGRRGSAAPGASPPCGGDAEGGLLGGSPRHGLTSLGGGAGERAAGVGAVAGMPGRRGAGGVGEPGSRGWSRCRAAGERGEAAMGPVGLAQGPVDAGRARGAGRAAQCRAVPSQELE